MSEFKTVAEQVQELSGRGLTQREISTTLGIGLGSVNRKLRKAGHWGNQNTCPACFAAHSAAREAQKPKLKEGQEIWLHGEYIERAETTGAERVRVRSLTGVHEIAAHPDDLRTDPPQGGE